MALEESIYSGVYLRASLGTPTLQAREYELILWNLRTQLIDPQNDVLGIFPFLDESSHIDSLRLTRYYQAISSHGCGRPCFRFRAVTSLWSTPPLCFTHWGCRRWRKCRILN